MAEGARGGRRGEEGRPGPEGVFHLYIEESMEKYVIPMVPGPVSVPREILSAGARDFGSADLEPEYVELYLETERLLRRVMRTENRVAVQTGEGMLGLWAAMKSTLAAGDRVLALSTGLFGDGFADMARAIGCETRLLSFGDDETLRDFDAVERAIREFRPKMITMVQNETPSGTMNSVAEVGELKRAYGVPLLCVDVVSGVGGTDVRVDEWGVDLALGGSQKCLSMPPSMSFVAVSEAAWEAARERRYEGYEALLPFADATERGEFPYTPYWQGTAQLKRACELVLEEGLENCAARHERMARYCRERVREMDLELFPAEGAVCSPTVTAVKVPAHTTWERLDADLRVQGLAVGGNYGRLAGKVFRIGHMGTQANMNLLKEAMDILETVAHDI